MKTDVIIPSAGSGTRMNKSINKLFLPLGDGCVLEKTFRAFLSHPDIENLIVPCREEDQTFIHSIIEKLGANDRIICVLGGKTRMESVLNALREVKTQNLLIHDGARPFISSKTIIDSVEAALEFGASVPGITPTDTQKQITKDGFIEKHLERKSLVAVQTPQCFEFEKLFQAHQKAILDKKEYTDDTEIWGKYCGNVKVVPGDSNNIKITYPSDLERLKND